MSCRRLASRETVNIIQAIHNRDYQLIIDRTNIYNHISGFYFLASVLGSAIGSLLLSNHVYILNGMSIVCFLVTAYVATLVPAHHGRNDSLDEAAESFLESSNEGFLIPTTPDTTFSSPRSSSKVPSPSDCFLLFTGVAG